MCVNTAVSRALETGGIETAAWVRRPGALERPFQLLMVTGDAHDAPAGQSVGVEQQR